MSSIGSPVDTSLLQAAQAQQVAAKRRDRERAATDSARRYQDLVDLKVAGMESAEALRKLPNNDSEQADAEHDAQPGPEARTTDEDRPHIDVQA
jgi:hypothetical protein